MSRKDYELIARTIKALPTEMRKVVADFFADRLAEENANFNRDKFIKAAVGG